ncbi:MAG: hypothetical protein R3C10_22935 [Pirellulales bacterium]|nr:hypothetical protein [Planctomycetales bacterium]
MLDRWQRRSFPWHRALTVTLLCAGATLLLAGVAEACPNCKNAISEQVANGGGGDPVRGFYYSILFMMSMPFLLVGSFTSLMYVQIRKARRAAQNQQATKAALDEEVRQARGN